MRNLSDSICSWFQENKRDLPWRETNDPYRIWVSEIILQQTRINQGITYYNNFLDRFPEIKILALASEHEVLKQWQGLGYYSRARNMHITAKRIVNEYHGKFPADYAILKNLKGIGTYTAAAIASIAFNLPFAVLDGNVFRFLARFFGIEEPINSSKGKKLFLDLAGNLMDNQNPGLHNQAMMEFGALQCTPLNPDCRNCLLNKSCIAYRNDAVRRLPVKSQKSRQKVRFFNYFLIENNNKILIHKRNDEGIWRNLYQLPLVETTRNYEPEEFLNSSNFKEFPGNMKFEILQISRLHKHILSHQIILARFYHLMVYGESLHSDGNIEVLKEDISKFAVPRLIETYLAEKGFL